MQKNISGNDLFLERKRDPFATFGSGIISLLIEALIIIGILSSAIGKEEIIIFSGLVLIYLQIISFTELYLTRDMDFRMMFAEQIIALKKIIANPSSYDPVAEETFEVEASVKKYWSRTDTEKRKKLLNIRLWIYGPVSIIALCILVYGLLH
jgi:hypothetical protein